MTPTTYFDLFKISFDSDDEDPTPFKDFLDNELEVYVQTSKNGNKIDLDGKVKKDGELYYGVFLLLQTNNLPPKARFGKEPIGLLDDEDEETGLGHYTLFIYDSTNEVIAISKNRNGVSSNGIVNFFQRNYHIRNLELEVIINPAELKRLNKLTSINTFEINIAKPESSVPFVSNKDSLSVSQVMGFADMTKANVVKLHLGIGYERAGSLKKGGIVDFVRNILKTKEEEITKIEIRGREGDEQGLEMIDLINNKVHIAIESKKVRSISRAYLINIIKKAIEQYRKIKPDVDTVYKVRRNRH